MSLQSMKERKSGSSRRFPWAIGSVLILTLVAVGLFFLPFSPLYRWWQPAEAADPQYEAFLALEAVSETPPTIYYQNGFPRFVAVMVPASGEDSAERAQNFLTTYAALYLQDNPDFALQVRRIEGGNDESVIFYQTYRGLPVFAAEIAVNLDDDKVFATIGGLMTETGLDITPVVTAVDAEAIARVDAGLAAETALRADTRLEIFDQSTFDEVPPDPHLTWHVFLSGNEALEVLVDAHTGEVVFRFSQNLGGYDLDLEDANGEWADPWGSGGNNCYYTTDADDAIADEEDFDSDYNSDAEAVAMWHYSARVYNFFNNTYGLDSYDGDGEDIEIYIHAGGVVIEHGAHWKPACDFFEYSDGWVGLDVVGHEFTHAVIEYSSNLVYANQPGALNESFADIFGSLLDGNWLFGDNRVGGGGAIRDMSTPPIHGQPDTMPPVFSPNTKEGDWGGVHTNSGIHNKAAYLIAAGGTHNGINVAGMGRGKMGILMWYVMRNSPSGMQFIDARNNAVAWAEAWARSGAHGFTRQDVCTVRNAYASVGLGLPDLDCNGAEDAGFLLDRDTDGIPDRRDNCFAVYNPDQRDNDRDGSGDVCDPDDDNDDLEDERDNCPRVANFTPYTRQVDSDGNGIGDACQDTDHDTIIDVNDNCPRHFNTRQEDTDRDGVGDICDPDMEGDGLVDKNDNCPRVSNAGQEDKDNDGVGDACDNCYSTPNPDQGDVNENGVGDACDPDADGDGIPNDEDNCSLVSNEDQADLDGNGVGSMCDVGEPTRILRPEVVQALLSSRGGRVVRIPLPSPECPTCPRAIPQEYCHALTLANLNPNVGAFVTNDRGAIVAHGRNNGQALNLRYHPLGGVQYYLTFVFHPEYDATLPVIFDISSSPATCPRPVIPELAVTPEVQPLTLKSGGSPDPAYYGQCAKGEPTTVNFEAFVEGDTSSMEKLGIWYTYFNAAAFPIMGDFIEMLPASGGAYTASLDLNVNAPFALANGAGTIQFFAQAQDSRGNVLAQSDGAQITIYPCAPAGVTVVPPEEPPTPTPWPTKTPPGPVDHDGDGYYPPDDCDDYNSEINPGAPEEDNGLDDNCNGKVDDGFDYDGDGYTPIAGSDCNDSDPSIHPGAQEYPNDKVDSNCNGEDNSLVPPQWPEVAMPTSPPGLKQGEEA
ncbi:MAG: hypothetical protein FJZ96_09865 [Chloroflexi bacterium]|nr:hypothetical protein [Chloroflexota bacterium]